MRGSVAGCENALGRWVDIKRPYCVLGRSLAGHGPTGKRAWLVLSLVPGIRERGWIWLVQLLQVGKLDPIEIP